MSLKQEIVTWVTALEKYDNNEFEAALEEFERISDTSKILFNMGVIHATLGEHDKAVACYQRAVRLDQYLAVAYFQQGVSNFLLGDFEEALANFNDTLLYLRGNTAINYEQLGLMFKLYSCEVLFNRGLCYIYLQQKEAGLQDLAYAAKEKMVEDHNVIDEAIKEEAEGYTVFSIPVGVVYRPNEAKVRNLKTKDYLGKARLVAASDRSNAFTGFAGSGNQECWTGHRRQGRSTSRNPLLRRHQPRQARSSEQETTIRTPNNRNVFPPTPPPENDKQPAQMSRGMSVRNGGAKPVPSKLNLDRARPNDRYERNSPDELSRRPSRATSAAPTRSNTQRQAPRGRVEEEDDDAYPDLYDMYQGGGGSNGGGSRTSKAPKSNRGGQGRYIEEEEEGSDYEDASFDEGDFEMVSNRRAPGSVSGASRRSSSRRGPTKVRVKVHAGDVRYIMVGMAVEFPDLVSSIQAKFGLRRRFKIKVKDDDSDGDMITMGDQDDLDMIMQTVVETAKRQRLDTGKMEVWVEEQ